ncbi:MAG: SAM-dependent methyltransferase [Candidatus Nomurabacteria bacterium]|jgi:type I restriction-modification system DNA methylase subunit|nr:SAM-dependent methyltransferase [Candidatus Nomurabacteria bacterium]
MNHYSADHPNWKLEEHVDDYVKGVLNKLKVGYRVKSDISDHMKQALKGSSKTKKETAAIGEPDFNIDIFNDGKTPVIIEDKRFAKSLIYQTKEGIVTNQNILNKYAVNDAIYYAQRMIASDLYKEVVAIGVAGDNAENTKIAVYYVFGPSNNQCKAMKDYITLDFLENDQSFADFYKNATLTEEEKQRILIDSRDKLQKYAKELNRLMHNHAITAPQRVLYVSGMLLAMQDLKNDHKTIKAGLNPDDLNGLTTDGDRDGETIVKQVNNFLQLKDIPRDKVKLMIASFNEISKDTDRDQKIELDPLVGKLLSSKGSVNKQIFAYIYEYIYKSIDGMSGHLDIMGEMYSEFLKYALGDGKEIGIVLTPPYVTKMMAEILGVNKDSRVMDLATGSAGFLISAMTIMISEAEKLYGKDTVQANEKTDQIKNKQLLGVELNAEMFTLASTNMILRGDGSSNIQKGSSFDRPETLYANFGADKLLLNPPFSFRENGMPFLEFGLRHMKIGGRAAIIIQDSAGSGKAVASNQKILKSNQLIASVKMPVDLFVPMAGVQTSIYVVEHTGKPHDYEKQVKFIDFRNDGYKRAKRGIEETDYPTERYQDIVQIYKNGRDAKVRANWDLDKAVVMDEITNSGADWNFDQHQKIDTRPTEADFMKVVSDYLAWEVSQVLKGEKNA